MTEAGKGFEVAAKHKIIGGAALVAMLAGAAVGVLDYPWQRGVAKVSRQDAQRRAVVAAALTPQAGRPRPAAPAARPAAVARNDEVKPATAARRQERRARPAKARSSGGLAAHGATHGIDARYNREVARHCVPGVAGILCRESIKWRLCQGRWSRERREGETRCHVGNAALASAG